MVYVVRFNYGKGKLYSGNIREGYSVQSINVNSLLLAIFCFYIISKKAPVHHMFRYVPDSTIHIY